METQTIQLSQLSQPSQPSHRSDNRSAVVRGVQMPAHQVHQAIDAAVAAGKISEAEGEDVFWLYAFSQDKRLSYEELGDKCGLSGSTVNFLFHGNYKADSWSGPIKRIHDFRVIQEEEEKKKSIGFVQTETAKILHAGCKAALNDGWPVFVYGASQLGKTTALEDFARLNNHGRTRYIRLGSGWTRARFVRELAHMLGNGVKATRQWALEDAIIGGLNRHNLLIVDEFHLALTTINQEASRSLIEFIREIHDRTQCGVVMCATKVGLELFENSKNRQVFEQFQRRGVVKVVLPDVPKVKDINDFARSFDLPLPTGQLLADIKHLIKSKGLGVFVKYLQKAYALAKDAGETLEWGGFLGVVKGYAQLATLKAEY